MSKKNKSPFNVGYSEVREKLSKRSKFLMSCKSCRFFYQDKGEDTELCHNSNVTEYDMVHTPTDYYCLYWDYEGSGNKKPSVISPRSGIEEFAMRKYFNLRR